MRRAQRKRSFARKPDADRWRAEVEHSLATGAYVDPVAGRQTFREYAEQWRLAQPHRPNTVARVRSQLERQVYPVLGDRSLPSIRPSQLQAFVTGLDSAPSTVRPIWSCVRAILGAAVRDRLIGLDPCKGIRLPELPRRQVMPMTVGQVEALIGALPERYRALAVVCAGAGPRQGEAFGLQVRDVDFLRRVIRVERQIQGSAVCPLKNRSSTRTVPVGATVTEALAAHLAAYPAAGEMFVFHTPAGRPLTRHAVDRDWKLARDKAGVPGVGMHALRHFFASVLIAAGRSVKTVSERLGHSNAAMTLNVYAHLWPADDELDRRAVDDVFRRDVPRMRPAEGSSA